MNTAQNTLKKSPVRIALLLIASAFVATAAHAEGNAEEGELLAYTCMGCHGIEGYRNAYPSYRVPKLGGQKAGYIENALRAYRDGNRAHPTMQAQGTSLSDQDIEDLAAYFEGEEMVSDQATQDSIKGLDAARTCLTCHGAESAGVEPTPPTLAGQWQSYLEHSLKAYQDGSRPGNVMTAFASGLTAEDIERIARFYSRQDDGLRTPTKDD